MSRKGRQRNQAKRVRRRATTRAEQTLTKIIGLIGFFFIFTPFTFFPELKAAQSSSSSRELLELCISINIITVILRVIINAQVRQLESPIFDDEAVHRKFRRYLIAHVALSIFSNLVLLIPILYNRGFIDRWVNWLQAHGVTNSLALGLSFSVAAIISGVIGNSAYYMLKQFVLRAVEKSAD